MLVVRYFPGCWDGSLRCLHVFYLLFAFLFDDVLLKSGSTIVYHFLAAAGNTMYESSQKQGVCGKSLVWNI